VAKLYATETALAHESLQVHGGIGYTKELPIERYFSDSRFMMIGGVQVRHEVHHTKKGVQGNGRTFMMLPAAFA